MTKVVILICAMSLGSLVRAGEAVQGNGPGPQVTAPATPQAPADQNVGDGESEEAPAAESHSSHPHVMGAGHSWYNTQLILQKNGLTKCHLGGMMASGAIPYLEKAGFCNVIADKTDPAKLPVGTVWVYSGGRAGNTIVKQGKDEYFDNRKMSALPHPRNQKLIGIMKPKCGKVTMECAK
jgi:hypothetical protein